MSSGLGVSDVQKFLTLEGLRGLAVRVESPKPKTLQFRVWGWG